MYTIALNTKVIRFRVKDLVCTWIYKNINKQKRVLTKVNNRELICLKIDESLLHETTCDYSISSIWYEHF